MSATPPDANRGRNARIRPTGSPGRGRRIVFAAAACALGVTAGLTMAELIVRLSVPEETFWPVSNIYSSSAIPGVVYTYKPRYEGTAFGVDLQTNRLGFRGREWASAKHADGFRVALVGDSHAFGFGVPFESSVGEILASALEARFRAPVEVMNFGVNGFNTAQELAVVQRLVLGFVPDLLILMPSNNDHEPALRADAQGWLHWDGASENQGSRIIDESIDKLGLRETPGWRAWSRLFQYANLVSKRRLLASQAQRQRVLAPSETTPASNWNAPPPRAPSPNA